MSKTEWRALAGAESPRGMLAERHFDAPRGVRDAILLIVLALVAFLAAPVAVAQQIAPLDAPNVKILTAGTVNAMARQPDGSLIVGGSFTSINGVARTRIAKFKPDGTLDETWAPSFDGTVYAIAVDSLGDVYVGGLFNRASGLSRARLAKVDRSSGAIDTHWQPATNGIVYALAVADVSLYVGGEFNWVSGRTRNRLVKVDRSIGVVNTSWDGNANGTVYALASDSGGHLYVGGDFETVGGASRANIARLGTSTGAADTWAGATNGTVNALALSSTALYAGGNFVIAGGLTRHFLASFSTASPGAVDPAWDPAPSTIVNALALVGGNVYAAGSFELVGGAVHHGVARLAATGTGLADDTWNPKVERGVLALAPHPDGSGIDIGGRFTSVDAERRFAIATIAADGSLSATDNDAETAGQVDAVVVQPNGGIIVGGRFGKVGSTPRANLLRLKPDRTLDSDWAPDADGEVTALLAGPDNAVYAGGAFASIGGLSRGGFAKIDGGGVGAVDANWNTLADFGLNALAWAADGDIIAAGYFSLLGPSGSRRFLMKIEPNGDGSADAAWDPNPDNIVRALAVGPDGSVYAGGDFTQIGGLPRNSLSKLDAGSGAADASWNPSPDDLVDALAADSDGSVFVAGLFDHIGGQARDSIAKLDPGGIAVPAWTPTHNSGVSAFLLDGGQIYVGGNFNNLGGEPAVGLARLSTLTGDADPEWLPGFTAGLVRSIAKGPDEVIYAGGSFATVSGASRIGIAALPSVAAADTTLTITAIDPEPSRFGEPYAVAFEVESPDGTPTGSVVVSDDYGESCGPVTLVDGTGECDLASFAKGGETITAVYSPDSILFAGSETTAPHFVNDATPIVTIVSDTPDPTDLLQFYTVTVHVEPAIAGLPTPTGQVDVEGGTDGCSATLDADANASCTVFASTLGTFDLVASYFGDAIYDWGDSVPEPHTVGPAATTISAPVSGGFSVATEPVPFFVNLGSDLGDVPGTVTIGDGESSCTAEIEFNFATCDVAFAHAGIHEVTARYDGDAEHAPAVSDPAEQFVDRASTHISIRSHLPEPSVPGQPVTVTVDLNVEPPGAGFATGQIEVNAIFGSGSCTIAASGESCDLVFDFRGEQFIDAFFAGNEDFQATGASTGHRVNELPFANNDFCATNEDQTLVLNASGGVLANDTDEDGDPLFVADSGTRTAGGIGGTVTLAVDGSYTYMPPPNANGNATFEYTVSDGLETAMAEVTISVAPVNDPPTFTLAASPSFAPGTIGERTTFGFATMTSSGPPDESNSPLAWHVRSISDPQGVLSAPATISFDGTLTSTLSGHGGVATLGVTLQDDGGTENGGNDTSPEQTFTITVGAGSDLAIAIFDGTDFVSGGQPVVYLITASNAGPDGATGARALVRPSPNLTDVNWTCTPSAGATCTSSGSGEIQDFIDLPAGASVVYELTATVEADPELPAEMFATIAALGGGSTDFNPNNDSASDTDATGIFADGYDTPPSDAVEDAPTAARRR